MTITEQRLANVAYLRMSKDEEGDELGVDRQRFEVDALAKSLGVAIDDYIVDNDISAYDERKKRPGFERLVLLMNESKVGWLLAYDTRRLYRRLPDLAKLTNVAGSVEIRTVKSGRIALDTADGRMMANIYGSIAQGESDKMGERLTDRNNQKARKGEPHGGGVPPFGYVYVDRTYRIHEVQAPIVRRIVTDVLAKKSLYSIAAWLNEEGVPTRDRANAAKRWRAELVKAVVTNPGLAGLRVLRGDVTKIPGNWEPLITKAEHAEVCSIVLSGDAPTGRKRNYLLSGLLRNEVGERMKGRKVITASGRERYQYTTGNPVEMSVSINLPTLDEHIVQAVLVRIEATTAPKPESVAKERAALVADVEALEQEIVDLNDDRGQGVITREEWSMIHTPLKARLAAARDARDNVQSPLDLRPILDGEGTMRERWDARTLGERQAILAHMIDHVVVLRGQRGGRVDLPIENRVPPEGILWRT